MSCGNRCHEIGGPWIAEDPDCPVHGRDARERESEWDAERIEYERRIADLERRVRRLEDKVLG